LWHTRLKKKGEAVEKNVIRKLISIQKDEIEGYYIYKTLAAKEKDPSNKAILKEISDTEKNHYEVLKRYTQREVAPSALRIAWYYILARTAGLTFTLKLMEKGEVEASALYDDIEKIMPEAARMGREEDVHEKQLLDMLNEEKLHYMGSVVLGLNDALVELSGALAGFTFAVQNSRTIALLGLITGIAASFSMAASEFLSQRQEGNHARAFTSSLYTGLAYVGTVILLTLPFFLFVNPFVNLVLMLAAAILIILAFNFYISVAKDLPFRRRFLEMALISLGVALLSFGIGWAVRTFLGLEI